MDSKHSESVDAPALARRRRKVARQTRDKTPEGRVLGAHKYSDDDDEENETTSSTQDQQRQQQQQRHPPRRSTPTRSSKTPPLSPSRVQQQVTATNVDSKSTNHNRTTTTKQKTPPLSPTRQPMDILHKLRKSLSPEPKKPSSTAPVTVSTTTTTTTTTTGVSKSNSLSSPPTPPVRKNSPTRSSTVTTTTTTSPSTTVADGENVQTVRMQIRPPGSQHTISAHESKILRRRNRQFAGQAARSQSQPRENSGESPNSPEVNDLLRTARRSLSSTRHRDETDESGQSSSQLPEYSPLTDLQNKYKSSATENGTDTDKLSKLEKNLKRFDDERRKFELEKKKFDRERRDIYKLRYRQLVEAEERKKMIENYRKNSGDSIELLKLPVKTSQSFKEPKRTESHAEEKQTVVRRSESNRRLKTFKDYESSTVSESDSEFNAEMYRKSHHPPRRINRGPPPTPPVEESTNSQKQTVETTAENKSVSRNSSLSPIRRRKPSKISEEREMKPEGTPAMNSNQENKEIPNLEPSLTLAETKEDAKEMVKKPGLFARIFGKTKTAEVKTDSIIKDEIMFEDIKVKKFSWAYLKMSLCRTRLEWKQFKQDHYSEVIKIRLQRNQCISHFIILGMLLGFGALAFRFTEGNVEGVYKCEIKKVKRDFIDHLWIQSHNMREEDWKSTARNRLRTFEEEIYNVYDAGPTSSYSGMKAWSFINSITYCWTIITQIGYGHIAPKTTLGQGITIVYAIFGIPIFLILLADFGKLFTRVIKFVWAYVRRVYYTGTCRKVRKSQQMQDVMKGVNTVYDVAIRRPSQYIRDVDIENADKIDSEAADTLPETPTSPYPETLEIDDDFNLPVSVATVVLVCYIIVGAFVYPLWEVKWSYFEAFYFVFISMSTIGFGDYVPDHPIFMMLSTVYLVFGLALTSMFINVVQIKLSDSFRQASAKIGATIGFSMTEEELSKHSQLGTPIPPGLNNIPEENDLEDREVRNITGVELKYNNTENLDAPPPLLPRQPRTPVTPQPQEPKKKKKGFF